MTVGFKNGSISQKLTNSLAKHTEARADAMEKLSSGSNFSVQDPQPAQRATSDGLDFKLRGLAVSKRNINDAVSLIQTGDGAMNELNNMVIRMKELSVTAASTTISNQERRYLLIEYEALHDEIDRIAKTTEFNGIPLLNGDDDRTPKELTFRFDDPTNPDDPDSDHNLVKFEGLKDFVATAAGLGLQSAREILRNSNSAEGVILEEIEELMLPEEEGFSTTFDQAIHLLSTQRAMFGALQSRMQRASDFIDVYQENIAAAKSKISDTDYAQEIVKLAQSSILMQASSGLLAQANFDSNLTLNLLASTIR